MSARKLKHQIGAEVHYSPYPASNHHQGRPTGACPGQAGNDRHCRQGCARVAGIRLPRLARKRVDAVTTADVMAVLPIWSTKRVTAGRVRQRIGAVMKWAVTQGYRDDNPAGDAISANNTLTDALCLTPPALPTHHPPLSQPPRCRCRLL